MSVKKFAFAVSVGLTTLIIWNKFFKKEENQS